MTGENGRQVTIVGCGGWGTALATVLVQSGHRVTVWGVEEDYVPQIAAGRENVRYLPGVTLPDEIVWTTDLAAAVVGADVVVMATPTLYMRPVCRTLKPLLEPEQTVVNVAKGIEDETLLLGSRIIRDVCGEVRLAGLYGPSHAEEVARGLPTTVVATSRDQKLARRVQELFIGERFRVYTNTDFLGVELGAALKNVIAIAAGICHGLGFGDNAMSALVARGLAEITRLGVVMGARRGTFAGLTGLGDLITTCFSPHGRNRQVGIRIAKGETLEEITQSMKMVAEGVRTSLAARALAQRHNVVTPITNEVCLILFEHKNPRQAVEDLMSRPPKPELDEVF